MAIGRFRVYAFELARTHCDDETAERRIYAPSFAPGGSKYRRMKDHPAGESCSAVQTKALASAILLRNCSLRGDASVPVRRAYRTQMRTQAIKWRRAPGPTATSSG